MRPNTQRFAWACALWATVLLALAVRVIDLDARPMHTDEAVQAVKFGKLLESGHYVYNPEAYHGPTLYYLTLPLAWLSGVEKTSDLTPRLLRLVPALAGVGMLLLLLLVRDGMSRTALLVAAVLTAVSPIMAYYGRYYVQETLLVLFTFGMIACGWRYTRNQGMGWAVAAGICAGLVHATKETSLIIFAALFLACIAVWRASKPSGPGEGGTRLTVRMAHLLAGAGAAVVVSVLFYSSFLTNLRGPLDAAMAYAHVAHRATGDGHEKPWWYYLALLGWHRDQGLTISEGFILILAVLGMWFSNPWNRGSRELPTLGSFLSAFSALLLAAYCLVPYKTPWLMTGVVHVMILLAGIGAAELLQRSRTRLRRVAVVVGLAAGTLHLANETCAVCFRYPADTRNPYAYAHTSPDITRLSERVHALANVHPNGDRMVVKVVADEYWPLPWYLRDFAQVGYWKTIPDDPKAPVVVASPALEADLVARLGDNYVREYFELRPGVLVVGCFETGLWERFLENPPTEP